MADEESLRSPPDDLSADEARRYLIRFLGQHDLYRNEEIYEELRRNNSVV